MNALTRAFSAELVRSRRTFGGRLWATGLVVAALQCAGWFVVATRALSDWQQLLAWQGIYVTGLAGPLAALLGALAERREAAARSGGTDWRAPSRRVVRAARLLVLALELLMGTAAMVLPMLVFGMAVGLPGAPVARLLGLTVVVWLQALPWLAVGFLVGARLGVYAAAGAGLVGQVLGTLRAESETWWAEPWAWCVRGALPLLHIHANGIVAPEGDPVRDIAVLPPVALAAALALVLGTAGVLLPPARERVGRAAGGSASVAVTPRGEAVVRGRQHVLGAVTVSLRAWWVWGLPLAALAAITLGRLVWSPGYVHGIVGLLLVPGLAALLACLMARTQEPALRALATRVAPARWAAWLLVVLLAVTVPVVVWGALLAGRYAGSLLVVGSALLLALLLIDLWLATRFGTGAALGVTAVGVVWSVVFGGSQLAEAPWLWLLGPWAYAYSATSGERMVLAAGLSLAVVPIAGYLWVRAVRRHAAYA